MNSNQPNDSSNPVASASSLRDNPCYHRSPSVAALQVFADDGISYLLPYSQFLYAKRSANEAMEKQPDAPPQKLLIHFVAGDVVVLGSDLRRVEDGIQQYELSFVKSVDRRLATTLTPHIAAVAVTLTKETV